MFDDFDTTVTVEELSECFIEASRAELLEMINLEEQEQEVLDAIALLCEDFDY